MCDEPKGKDCRGAACWSVYKKAWSRCRDRACPIRKGNVHHGRGRPRPYTSMILGVAMTQHVIAHTYQHATPNKIAITGAACCAPTVPG